MYRGDERLFTMGPAAVEWIQNWLSVPKRPGVPFRLTRRQIKFVCDVLCYELTDSGFILMNRQAFYVGPKEEGKTPLCAAIGAFRFRGPSVPVDVDRGGVLRGREDPGAMVQIFANSELQGLRTTWRPLVQMLRHGRLKGDRRLWIGDTMIKYEDRVMSYDPLTQDSAEGADPALAIVEESQYAIRRDRKEAIGTIVGNVGKTDGVVLFPTNAPRRGGGSYADEQLMKAERNEAESAHVLYKRLPEPIKDIRSEASKPEVMGALDLLYGEAANGEYAWVNLERVYRTMMTRSEADARRLYLNEPTTPEGQMVDADLWESLSLPGERIPDGQFVVLGFDGSEAEDATALVAVSCTAVPHVEVVGIWKRPDGVAKEDWRIPKGEVMGAFLGCRDRWKVEGVVADPSIAWKSFITELADDLGEGWGSVSPSKFGDRTTREGWGLVCEIWMNNSPKLCDVVTSHLVGLLDPGDAGEDAPLPFTHDGDELLTEHSLAMQQAHIRKGSFASVGKKSEAEKDQIDAGVALMLGLWGAAQFPPRDDTPTVDGDGQAEPAKKKTLSVQDQIAKRMSGG